MVKLPTASRDAACNAIADAIDAGGAGELRIRSGSAPAIGSADSGTLLATCPFASEAFGAAATGVANVVGTPQDAGGTVAGTAGYFRIYSGAGTRLAQGSVAIVSADMVIDVATFVVSGTATLTGMTLTVPEGS